MTPISIKYLDEKVEFVDKNVFPSYQFTRQTDQTLPV